MVEGLHTPIPRKRPSSSETFVRATRVLSKTLTSFCQNPSEKGGSCILRNTLPKRIADCAVKEKRPIVVVGGSNSLRTGAFISL
jgi:hypothetical protein